MITLIGGCVSAKCSYISTSSTVYLKHMTSCSPKFIQVIARFLLKRIRIWRFEELDFFLSHFPNHVQKSPHFCFQFHQPLATVVFSTINWRFGNIFKHFNDSDRESQPLNPAKLIHLIVVILHYHSPE